MSIERNFDESLIAGLAAAEKQVQQHYRPIIGVHKWFARRPGSLFRGLALAEAEDRPLADHYFESHDLAGVVLDPFMGGGTTLFEANRIGFSVVGFDTNPMSKWLVERELEELDVQLFESVGEKIAAKVDEGLSHLYETKCEECGDTVPVKSFLWVKTHVCSNGHETLLFPGPLVAGRKMKRHTHEVLVCGACRSVNQFLPGEVPEICPECETPFSQTKIAPDSSCGECGEEFHVYRTVKPRPPKHTLFALEYHCESCKAKDGRRGRFFKGADIDDHKRYEQAKAKFASSSSKFWPDDPIPPGDETNRLLRWGYRKFSELHNERQLIGLAALAREIRRAPESVRPALATVFSDFIRYQNMVCRYDTGALKILDVFSIHGFPVHRVQCEAALIGIPRVGSGGFRHFLAKYGAAKRYCQEPFEMIWEDPDQTPENLNGKARRKRKIPVKNERIAARFVSRSKDLGRDRAALLRCASIGSRKLPPETVDMVLTDPPYFANVQYSELMDFLYAWLRRVFPDTEYFQPETSRSKREVTGNVTGGVGINGFAEGLSKVYQAATEALKPGGPFAFTYHHNDLLSYSALVVAVLDSGLIPICTFTCHSEMRGSIHINSNKASHVDTVFLFRKPPVTDPGDEIVPVEQRFAEHVENLEDAHLSVSEGDRTCIWHGLVTEEAIRFSREGWNRDAPISRRMESAADALTQVNEGLDRSLATSY